ncbi:MAG: DUF3800 domain-containing protein [Pseudoruegeria sp.]
MIYFPQRRPFTEATAIFNNLLFLGCGLMKYTFFVDESGQSGIKRIRSDSTPGASRYMTLGGVLIPETKKEEILNGLNKLKKQIDRPALHCSKLKHKQIVRFAQFVADQQVLLFGVISLKETLGDYASDISHSDKRYYNKCAQYLLERLALAMNQKDIKEDDVTICFEEGNFDYNALRSLIRSCRNKPLRPATKNLKLINPYSINAQPKENEKALQLADLIAHALYQCVDDGPSTYGVTETRYVEELKSRFFSDPISKKVCGFGIYPVHELKTIQASKSVEAFLKSISSD